MKMVKEIDQTFETDRERPLSEESKHNQWLHKVTNCPAEAAVMHEVFPSHQNPRFVSQFST